MVDGLGKVGRRLSTPASNAPGHLSRLHDGGDTVFQWSWEAWNQYKNPDHIFTDPFVFMPTPLAFSQKFECEV